MARLRAGGGLNELIAPDPPHPSRVPRRQGQLHQADVAEAGGPPVGLMSHVVYPEGDGFVVAEVWRSESAGQHYVDEVLRPLVGGVSLTAADTRVRPVWSFARP